MGSSTGRLGGSGGPSGGLLTAVLTVVVVGLGFVVVTRTMETARLVEAIRTADHRLLVLAVGVYALSWPLRGRRYGDVLHAMGHRRETGYLTALVLLSQTANLVVPARAGDGVRAYFLNEHREVPYATGGASLAVERLFDLLALTALGLAALLVLWAWGDPLLGAEAGRYLLGAGVVAGLALLLTAGLLVVARSGGTARSSLAGLLDRLPLDSLADALRRAGGNVRTVVGDSWALATIGIGSLLVWGLDVLTAVVVLAALSSGALSLPSLLAVGTLAVTVGNLAKVLPLTQGGIGLYEAAFTAVVVALSPLGASVALAAAICDHGLKNAVTLAGGLLAGVGLNVSLPTSGGDLDGEDAEPADF